MATKTYGFIMDDGEFHKIDAENVMEAYKTLGKKTSTGELDFSRVKEFIFPGIPTLFISPIPIEQVPEEFQLILKKEKDSKLIFTNDISRSFSEIEDILRLKIKYEDYFCGYVRSFTTGKLYSWITA